MSSTLRTVAQIPPRIKYLLVVATADGSNNLIADACTSFTCPEGTFSESVISSTQATALTPSITAAALNVNDLYKDLGRQVVIYDATNKLHRVIYREVQLVDGDDREGVPANYTNPMFVRVWAASGQGVRVVRTGPGAH